MLVESIDPMLQLLACPGARRMQHTLITLARPAMVAAGFATEDEIDRHPTDLDRPDPRRRGLPDRVRGGRKQPGQQIRTTQ
jgi:hypothetical protein